MSVHAYHSVHASSLTLMSYIGDADTIAMVNY